MKKSIEDKIDESHKSLDEAIDEFEDKLNAQLDELERKTKFHLAFWIVVLLISCGFFVYQVTLPWLL